MPHSVTRTRVFHASDLLPTLAKLADSEVVIDQQIDGVDYSKMILEDKKPYRKEIIITDEVYGISSVIYKNYKVVNGTFVPLGGLVM